MAIVTRQFASWDNDLAVIYIHYDDGTLRVTDVQVVNGETRNVHLTIWKSGNVVYDQSFPPGTTTVTVPQQGNKRIDIIDNGRGIWSGVSFMEYLEP